MDKFNEYKLNLTEKNKDLIKSYLQKVKKIVDKYNIEKELYIDIEDMVFEKLSNAKTLNQLNITKILKEVGEPEVIFSDYIDNSSNSKTSDLDSLSKNLNDIEDDLSSIEKKLNNFDEESNNDKTPFYENMIKNGWTRDNKNAWVLGLSGMIGKKTNLPTWMIRTLFVLLTFAGGIGFLIYVILGFVIPIRGINYEGKTTFGYFRTQLYYFIKDSLTNMVYSIRDFILWSIKKIIYIIKITFNFIKSFFVSTAIGVLPVLRFLIFAGIALFLSTGFLGLIVLGALYFSNITIDNIDYMSVLPNYFVWGILTGIYSIGVFMIAFFLFSISGKWINKYILLSGFITFVIALFLGALTAFHLVQLYSTENTITQSTQIELTTNDNKNIVLDIYDIVNHQENFPFYSYRGSSAITLVNSQDNILKIDIENEFIGNDEIYEKISGTLIEPKLVNIDGKFKIENPKMFSTGVPPAPIQREITIYLPEGYTIEFDNYAPYLFYVTNAHLVYDELYDSYVSPGCGGKKMWYLATEERFVCELSEDEIKEINKQRLKRYVMVNFDTISTLVHKNEYKRNYWNSGVGNLDWRFENFYWIDNELLNFEFSDMSLDVRASVKIKETDDGLIEISDFKINYVGVRDYYFKSVYYVDITSIESFLGDEFKRDISTNNTLDYDDTINYINNHEPDNYDYFNDEPFVEGDTWYCDEYGNCNWI